MAGRFILLGSLLLAHALPVNAGGGIDVHSFANPCGRKEFRWTENGKTSTWSTEVIGRRVRNGRPVYLQQEYDETGSPNDQQFILADLSRGMFEAGGVNDLGDVTERTFRWNPPIPMLMDSFVPGKWYSARHARLDWSEEVTLRIKTTKEKVTVPFGTLDCYKVTRTVTGRGDRMMEQAWYAKHLGLVKRNQDGNLWELVSYQPAPWLTVEQPAGSEVFDSLSKKSFGSTAIGGKGKARTFVVKNRGTAPLGGIKVAQSGPGAGDFIIHAPAKTTLRPDASTTFTVVFKPRTAGTKNTVLAISSNDPKGNLFEIKLSGAGVK